MAGNAAPLRRERNRSGSRAARAERAGRAGLFTLEEAAERLASPISTVRWWRWVGRLPVVVIGRRIYVRQETINEILEGKLKLV